MPRWQAGISLLGILLWIVAGRALLFAQSLHADFATIHSYRGDFDTKRDVGDFGDAIASAHGSRGNTIFNTLIASVCEMYCGGLAGVLKLNPWEMRGSVPWNFIRRR